MKQRTNRSLRAKIKRGELDDLLSGKSNRYRRVYESWNISDYAARYDLHEAAQPLKLIWAYERVHLLDDLINRLQKRVNTKPIYEWVQREIPVKKRTMMTLVTGRSVIMMAGCPCIQRN